MRKYAELTKRAFLNSITYRSELILWLFLDTIPFIVLLVVWLAIYQTRDTISGYDLTTISHYYWLVLIINSLIGGHFEQYRVQQIREGKIDFYLTRPVSYIAELFFVFLGNKLFYLFLAVPFFTVAFVALAQILPLTLPHPEPTALIAFSGLLLTGALIEFFFALMIVLFGFWFEHSEGLEHFKWITTSLLSGSLFPLALLPGWLASLTDRLPFKYLYAIPIGVLQGTYSLTLTDLMAIGIFIGALALLSNILWHFARYQYASAGG